MNEALLHGVVIGAAVVLLWKGADWTIDGALSIARRFGLSEVVIGATVVALGTSAPEMVVTLVAALDGKPDISVGNVVGSNIFNVGLILGGIALVWGPINVPPSAARVHAPLLLAASIALIFATLDLTITRWEGALMVLALLVYIVWMIRTGESPLDEGLDADDHPPATALHYAMLVVGLGAIVGGARLLVHSASEIARMIGMNEWQIGLTVVAIGTSLPELVTAVRSAMRGNTGVMAGALIGSDLFNVLGVLGLAALIHPLVVDGGALLGVILMAAMVAILIPLLWDGRLTRVEGAVIVVVASGRWAVDLV